MGIAGDFNAIPTPNLQSEMQKAGSMCETGSFFRVVFSFFAQRIFPATSMGAAFHSRVADGVA